MLVHICCSVDSHYFLSELKKAYPNESLVGFFYDPNIHPYEEYELRFADVKRSCKKLGVKLFKGKYDYETWLNAVKGYESEPEKGARCEICFDKRMNESVKMAVKLKEKRLTTTLLTSPKKDLNQLKNALQKECDPYNIEFVAPDFRKNGGTQRQFEMAKLEKLYHQNYCGCLYALSKQKSDKNFIDELMSPITKQVLPASIKERQRLFKQVQSLCEKDVKFDLIREKFLNYRLLSALVKFEKKAVKSYVLFYSHFKNHFTKFSLNSDEKGIYRSFKDEIILLDFEYFNTLLKNKFANFNELFKKPLSIKQEIKLRQKIVSSPYNLSPIIVLESLENGRFEIIARSEIYFDIKEKIVKK